MPSYLNFVMSLFQLQRQTLAKAIVFVGKKRDVQKVQIRMLNIIIFWCHTSDNVF